MKTDRQLIERLLELQEHPEQVTDEQLQQALDDPQMRELVEQMAFAKRTFKDEELQAEELDVEGEWEKFAADHYGEDNSGKTYFTLFSSLFTSKNCCFVHRRTPCVGYGICGYPHSADGQ